MGARVYIPGLGRFLSVDPQQGGTPNNYTYPVDPVNDFDLDGNWGWKSIANIASWASIIPGPIGMIAGGVAAVSYAAAGDYKSAAIAAVGIAAAAVGAGAVVKAAQAARTATVATKAARIAANAVKGARTEKVAQALATVRYPLSKIETHAYEKIPDLGRRFIDIKATNRITQKVTAIEVKAGGSVYHKAQVAKDAYLRSNKGYNTKLWRFKW